jgi:hypothetical protein
VFVECQCLQLATLAYVFIVIKQRPDRSPGVLSTEQVYFPTACFKHKHSPLFHQLVEPWFRPRVLSMHNASTFLYLCEGVSIRAPRYWRLPPFQSALSSGTDEPLPSASSSSSARGGWSNICVPAKIPTHFGVFLSTTSGNYAWEPKCVFLQPVYATTKLWICQLWKKPTTG